MKKLRPVAVAGALIVSAVLRSAPALAADWSLPLPDNVLRGSETVGKPIYPRWDGFYFGGQIGRSFTNADFSNASSSQISYILANTELQGLVSDWTTLSKSSTGNTGYGGFIGYNIQWGEVITGFELNYNHLGANLGAQGSVGPINVPGATQPDGSTVMYTVTVTSGGSAA